MRRALVSAALGAALALAAVPSIAGVWPTEIERVSKQLESSDASERRLGAARLASLPRDVASPLVRKALDDPDADVRLAAASAVTAQRVGGVEEAVIPWLAEPDARLRLAACLVLRDAPSTKAVGSLVRALGDADVGVRREAAGALGNAASADAVAGLLGHLDDSVPEVRVAVVEALYRLGDTRAVVPLAGKIQDGAPEVRRALARALGELGDRQGATALTLALRDAVSEVRVDALASLGMLADPQSVPAIAPLADPASPPVIRRAALAALGKIGGADAQKVLVAALAHDEPAAASPAADALVSLGSAATMALQSVLASPQNDRAAAGAALALGRIGDRAALGALVQAFRKGVVPAHHAMKSLGMLGDPDALPVALELLSDRSPLVRAEARRTVARLLDERSPAGHAVDPILAALADPRASVDERASLLRLLGKTRSARAAQSLAPQASSPNLTTRLAAIEALGEAGQGGIEAPLLDALGADEAAVRAAAGLALSRAATDAVATKLLERAAGADEQDRGAIATALAGAVGRAAKASLNRAFEVARAADGAMRDAIVEGLARNTNDEAGALVAKLATSGDVADRRKAAEALASHPSQHATLVALLDDVDASVRAGAAWSIGQQALPADVSKLAGAISDRNVSVAANAATALGRAAARAPSEDAHKALCAAVSAPRPHVRLGALTGLRLASLRCGEGESERRALLGDPSPLVRAGAADLLRAVVSSDARRDARALSRCTREDTHGSVAQRCTARTRKAGPPEPVAVIVVAEGQTRPAVEAPFALVLADGTMRHGVTDRRGAVFERHAPRGDVRLDVPAPFVR